MGSLQILAQSPILSSSHCADESCIIGLGAASAISGHIMHHSRNGEKCNIGQNVVISSEATIGNNVKYKINDSVYPRCILERDVFCWPSTLAPYSSLRA